MSHKNGQDAVLTAATELFTTKGFASTSIRDICDAAEVTPPVLYYHFGNKEGLFEAVVHHTVQLDSFCSRLREALENASDPWEKLRTYLATYLTGFPEAMLNPGLHFQSSTQPHVHSLRRMASGIAQVHALACELLEDGIASGHFRDLDVDLTASCLLGLVDSFVRARVYLGVDYPMEQVEDSVVDLLTRGLISRTAPVDVSPVVRKRRAAEEAPIDTS